MRNFKFFNDGYYHIYNRGVEKREIFLDKADYYRFLKSTDEFNLSESKTHLVSIVCYCLMPNHFHFIFQQKSKDGISKFMQKLTTGYTMYFNKRYEHPGALLQGTFKAKHIENNYYLLHLARYVHLNPSDLYEEKDRAMESIFKYEWSSLPFYMDPKKKAYLCLQRDVILSQFKNLDDFKRDVANHVSCDLSILEDLKIEA